MGVFITHPERAPPFLAVVMYHNAGEVSENFREFVQRTSFQRVEEKRFLRLRGGLAGRCRQRETFFDAPISGMQRAGLCALKPPVSTTC